ncbi:MAG: 3-keto-5-aminohexanoate cleavage protein, partial [Candidatus Binatia bacterium]
SGMRLLPGGGGGLLGRLGMLQPEVSRRQDEALSLKRVVQKLIVAVGLNENVTRDENPNVPITPREIAEDVAACVEAGASIIHLHARDPDTGAPMMDDPEQYTRIYLAIRERTDALVYPTYPPGPKEHRYRHVVALAGNAAARLEIAPIIAGSADLSPVDARGEAPAGFSPTRTSSTSSSSRTGTTSGCRTTSSSPAASGT